MFSPELMKFIIKYQSKEFLTEEKEFIPNKKDEPPFGLHLFTKFASIPIKVER